MYVKEDPVVIEKGGTKITLALGIGAYNPDESKNINVSIPIYKPWLKYENTWYFVKNAWRYSNLTTLADYFKHHRYSEEIFLQCILEHI